MCSGPFSLAGAEGRARATLLPYTTLFRSVQPMDPFQPAEISLTPVLHREIRPALQMAPDFLAHENLSGPRFALAPARRIRSEEHTSELQSRLQLVCRLLLGSKKGTPRQSG